jgi:hypothetical protein
MQAAAGIPALRDLDSSGHLESRLLKMWPEAGDLQTLPFDLGSVDEELCHSQN